MVHRCLSCGKEFECINHKTYCGDKKEHGTCAWKAVIARQRRFRRLHPEYCLKEKEYKRGYLKRLSPERKEEIRLREKHRRLELRFSILKRDNFTCQYCGRKAPDVILQIDHMFPKSKGGLDKIENYKTTCQECNLGKSDKILSEFN
jgi:5-methylcytosine-specific restriction endonuclease McrA